MPSPELADSRAARQGGSILIRYQAVVTFFRVPTLSYMISHLALRESASIGRSPLSDEEVVARVRAGDTALYEILMRRYNQRLFRIARTILRNEAEAEDVLQEAYVR